MVRLIQPRPGRIVLLLSVTLVACGDNMRNGGADGVDAGPLDGGAALCAVTDDARSLMEELVQEALMDVVHTAVETHPQERGFSMHLIGVDEYFIGRLTLLGECTEESSFDPYCAGGDPGDPFYDDHDQCSRLGCEAANIGLNEMYWTMKPETDPEARHAFTYATTSPAGEAVADPNPYLVWRYDLTTPDMVTVTSQLDRALVVTPTGGDPVDLDHTGSLSATQVDFEPTGAALNLEFPDFLGDDATTLELSLDAEANGTGELRQGDQTIATITGVFGFDSPLVFSWCP